jgi:hypothetical protein
MPREIAKKAAATILLFVVGAVLGFSIAPHVFHWLASASNAPLVATDPTGSFMARAEFGLGCAILFGVTGFFGKSLPRGASLLAVGLAASAAVGAFYRANYAAIAATDPQAKGSLLLQELPSLRVPLAGAVTICLLAGLMRYFRRDQSNRTRT